MDSKNDSDNYEEENDLMLSSVFIEPDRPPSPDPTFAVYDRDSSRIQDELSWKDIRVRLVGSHPLWGHYLWNAARAFADYLDERPYLYTGLDVLELGAGAGLPSLVCAKNGARRVVSTDYPDPELISNLSHNVHEAGVDDIVRVQGFVWGHPVEPLLRTLHDGDESTLTSRRFSLVILSDLVFNHSQHDALLNSCESTLAASSTEAGSNTSQEPPQLLVFYTPHRPHLADKDMDFFSKATARGWVCEQVLKKRFDPMFPDDPGEEEVRATVYGWRLSRVNARVSS